MSRNPILPNNNLLITNNSLSGFNSDVPSGTINTIVIGNNSGRLVDGTTNGSIIIGNNAGNNFRMTQRYASYGGTIIGQGADSFGARQVVVVGAYAQAGGYGITAIGSYAGNNNTTNSFVSNSTFVGRFAGSRTVAGNGWVGVAIGIQAGQNGSGSGVIVGNQAGINCDGAYNTFVGTRAGAKLSGPNSTGGGNTLIGVNRVGVAITAGGNNTVMGLDSGAYITTGSGNTIIGAYGGNSITTTNGSVVIGTQAANLATNLGNNQIVIGASAARSANLSNIANNVIIGYCAGRNVTSVGSYGLVLIGDNAGRYANSSLLAIGQGAGRTSTGLGNVFIGHATASTNTVSGGNNTVIGHRSGRVLSNGAQANVFIGTEAARYATTADDNTVIGSAAGFNITTKSKNVLVGSGTDVVNASACIVLGVAALAQADNEFVIGSALAPITSAYFGSNVPSTAYAFIRMRINDQVGFVPFFNSVP